MDPDQDPQHLYIATLPWPAKCEELARYFSCTAAVSLDSLPGSLGRRFHHSNENARFLDLSFSLSAESRAKNNKNLLAF